MGGIPSAITEVGFFIRGVGTECSDEGNSKGKIGVLMLSIGSNGRSGKSGRADNPICVIGFKLTAGQNSGT